MPLLPSAVARISASSERWTSPSAPCLTLAPSLAPPPPPSAPRPAGGSTKTSPSPPQKASLRSRQRLSRLACMEKVLPQPPQWSSMNWRMKSWLCPNLTLKSTGKTTAMKTQVSQCGALSLNVHLSMICLHLPLLPDHPHPFYSLY